MLLNIIKECNIKEEGVIVLLDLGKINGKGLDLGLLKKIINFFQHNYTDILHRIIIYNYSFKFIWILNILKRFMDKNTAKKIIIDKNIGQTINNLLKDKQSTLLINSNWLLVQRHHYILLNFE